MERHSVEAIVGALNEAKVRYLIVGGLAVVAHGYVRFTADVDLVLDPEPASMKRAVEALSSLGYRPRAPVAFTDFADAARREQWAREKGLTVFSAHSAAHPATEVDLFVEVPFDFERAYAAARSLEVAPGRMATFVGVGDLIAMKQRAGRPQDLQDVQNLQSLSDAAPDG